MSAVNLDRIEAKPLRVTRRAAESGNGFGDGLVGHLSPGSLAGDNEPGRALEWRRRHPTGGMRVHDAHVPNLRRHGATGGVHLIDDTLPAFKRLPAVEM